MNRIKEIWERTFRPNKKTQEAMNMVILDAIEILSDRLEADPNKFKSIANIHYVSQLYTLFIKNPFLLSLVTDKSKNNNILEIGKLWEKELGWTNREIKDNKLFSLVHPEDHDRTIDAYTNIESYQDQEIFYNRYRCKVKTSKAFLDGTEYFVWLAWPIIKEYNSEDKYRFSIASIIPPWDPQFKILQDTYNKKDPPKEATQK